MAESGSKVMAIDSETILLHVADTIFDGMPIQIIEDTQ